MADYDEAVTVLTSALSQRQFPIGETFEYDGKQSQYVKDLPFYKFCPKDTVEQIQWRIWVRERMGVDEGFRWAINYCCSQDILFAFNTLFWIFEPRPTGRKLPFNSWPDQDEYILAFKRCIDQQRDAIGEKCRGVGWSYVGVGLGYYDWYWPPAGTTSMIGMVSRKREVVDSDDSDSLFWKLDYLHANMPECMRHTVDGQPLLKRTEFRFINAENGSAIMGYEAGPNAMTGGRKRWILHDEAAKFPANAQDVLDSTQHVTNCRIVISTFWHGTRTRFYQMARKEQTGALRVIGDWKVNPARAAGLYTFEHGQVKKLDPKYEYPDDYKFVNKDVEHEAYGGRIRSPWYDAECNRLGATRRSIAEEIDRDPQATGDKFFELEILQEMEASCSRPKHVGMIVFKKDDPRSSSFMRSSRGNLMCWADMSPQGDVIGAGPFCAGVDLAGGGGNVTSAYSALEIIDEPTGEQVLEFISNRLRPDDFADHCFAIFWWLVRKHGQGHLICNFEANSGLGVTFGNRLVALGWGNFFKQEEKLRNSRKRLMQFGWFNRDKGEAPLFELQRAVHTKECTVKSERVKNECGEYERGEKFELVHASSPASQTGTGKAHGDAAIAFALAWMARQDRRPAKIIRKKEIPPDSIAGMAMAEEARNRAAGLDFGWEDDDTSEVHPIFQAMEMDPYAGQEFLNPDAF
jgi:hypothetical protein